jgi:hypothetical protein
MFTVRRGGCPFCNTAAKLARNICNKPFTGRQIANSRKIPWQSWSQADEVISDRGVPDLKSEGIADAV